VKLGDWPLQERPQQKLLCQGSNSLSDGELLAVLLGVGPANGNGITFAQKLLAQTGGLVSLVTASPANLREIDGMGAARIARVQAAIELGKRYLQAPSDSRRSLRAPGDAARFFKARLSDLPHEVFGCLFLDTRHRLISYEELFRGTVDGATVHPREVLKRSLHHNATAIIIGHNHPSGISEPSEADRGITLRLSRALALVDIRLLDHLVVSRGGHVSLAERGWI
jgi:DNA repair protein RadC